MAVAATSNRLRIEGPFVFCVVVFVSRPTTVKTQTARMILYVSYTDASLSQKELSLFLSLFVV